MYVITVQYWRYFEFSNPDCSQVLIGLKILAYRKDRNLYYIITLCH